MLGGSGLALKLAVNARSLLLAAATASASGCVYFNSVYNANELFNRGKREIEAGNEAAGRATLNQSIQKAARVVEKNPDSKWADDSQRLIAAARVLLEDWVEAAEASRKLMGMISSRKDSAEAGGYLGMAEARLGDHALADSLIGSALEYERNTRRRAALHYSRGLARAGLGRLDVAEGDFREASRLEADWLDPRLERARLLVVLGRDQEAAFELSKSFQSRIPASEEESVYQTMEYLAAADAEAARVALVGIEEAQLSRQFRARLVRLRGDMNREVGREELAEQDYRLTVEVASESRAAVEASLQLAGMKLQETETLDDLDVPFEILRETRTLPFGSRIGRVGQMIERIRRLEFYVERGNVGYIAAAEVAREELGAPRLAQTLYLEYVDQQADGLWAPKAIMAFLELGKVDPPQAEELRQRLFDDYRSSAYVQAVLGDGEVEGFTYEQLEDGLRRQLQRLRIQADQVLKDPRRAATRQ